MKNIALPPLTTDLAMAILGVWKLKSREDVDAAGRVHVDSVVGRDPLGILCFGRGNFAAQFMKRERSAQAAEAEPARGKNNTVAVNGYDAYFGSYTVDEIAGTITTLIEGSISPANMGHRYVRDARVAGDELIIQLETTTAEGEAITRTNTFARVG